MVSELDALRSAQLLLDQHGAKEAWYVLTARAVEEHVTGRHGARDITRQVLAALYGLADGPEGKTRH